MGHTTSGAKQEKSIYDESYPSSVERWRLTGLSSLICVCAEKEGTPALPPFWLVRKCERKRKSFLSSQAPQHQLIHVASTTYLPVFTAIYI